MHPAGALTLKGRAVVRTKKNTAQWAVFIG